MPDVMSSLAGQLRKESRSGSRFAGLRVHFIGIGGSGMSGLARILIDAGARVSGSELKPNTQTFELTRRGVKISRPQMGELISHNVDLVVRTAAVPDSNPEFQAARALGLRHMKYAQLLGEVMSERLGVAVAGTHGKSTTTAMIAYALSQCGADPSFVIGGTVAQLGGGSHSGSGPAFVVEACEYDRSFHNLHPTIALITNIEADHLDCYKNIDEILESFQTFSRKVPSDGLILANGADAHVRRALQSIAAPVEWVTMEDTGSAATDSNGWRARVVDDRNGCWGGHVYHNDQYITDLRPGVAGKHNLFNATMALAACAACGVAPAAAAEALAQFHGVDRRMTEMGRCNGVVVVDDYGHHPTEIRATLAALRQRYRPQRLFCVFQPHQHSRTRMLLDDFATSFELADETIVPDIFFVRDDESEKQRVSASDLIQRVRGNGQSAQYLPEFGKIVDYLKGEVRPGDLIVTMGAGNVWEIARDLVQH
jgi:UDP-N-acetylmuramate--alanine ligase